MIRYIKFAQLPVSDQDRALAFYTDKIGMNVVTDAPYKDDWRWIELEIPGAVTRLMFTEQAGDAETDAPQLVLIVDDVNETHKELVERGVHFTQEPTAAPWNPGQVFAQFRDSEGNGIVIGSE